MSLLNSHATPAEELEQARESFLSGNFEAAVGGFSALLYPTSRLANATTIAEAHLLLGVCYFETKQRDSAEREFEEALLLNSKLRLDANLFSPSSRPSASNSKRLPRPQQRALNSRASNKR